MNELERLSRILIPHIRNIPEKQIAEFVDLEHGGIAARGAVEPEDDAVAVVGLAVGSIKRDAVQDDAAVLELEDERGTRAEIDGHGCRARDRLRHRRRGDGRSCRGDADAATGRGVGGRTGAAAGVGGYDGGGGRDLTGQDGGGSLWQGVAFCGRHGEVDICRYCGDYGRGGSAE